MPAAPSVISMANNSLDARWASLAVVCYDPGLAVIHAGSAGGQAMKIDVDPEVRNKWQGLLDVLAELAGIPAALIMHVRDDEIEVFAASAGADNPYKPGDAEKLEGSGLYCEWVIAHRERLLVPDARRDTNWDENPDIKLGMVSYLGFPIAQPDGSVFGTICVLDRKENAYSQLVERVILQFRELVQSHLALLHQRMQLLKTLHGIVPICSSCRKIRDEQGTWHRLESYLTERTNAEFSHGLCPSCLTEYFPELPGRSGG